MSQAHLFHAAMTLREYVQAGIKLRELTESPAEREMLDVLLRIVQTFVYLQSNSKGEHLILEIEAQAELLGGKYRADWLIKLGTTAFVLEIDGFAYHADQAAFQRDRQRDRDMAAFGFKTVRFTAKELLAHPNQVETELLLVLLRAREALVHG